MAYLGGKSKNADHILKLLNDPRFDGMHYLEPFVGYAHILRRVVRKASYTASDSNPLLMRLLVAAQKGEDVPHVSKHEYERLKGQTGVTSLKRAAAAFTYSYNGKEWGGYTATNHNGGNTRYPAEERRRYYKTLHENDTFSRAELSTRPYWQYRPMNKLIYCDPPYQSTTSYGRRTFDHDRFWDTMRSWSLHNVVCVSEYTAPSDFVCVSRARKYATVSGGAKGVRRSRKSVREECVFMYKQGRGMNLVHPRRRSR